MIHYYWYVTYTYNRANRESGGGGLAMSSTNNWFPIRASMKWIEKDISADTVVILSWRRISKQQREEYLTLAPKDGGE